MQGDRGGPVDGAEDGVQSYRGLKLVGGHPALDLINSVKYRGEDAPGDVLQSFADLLAWSRLAGLVSPAEAEALSARAAREAPDRLAGRVRAFREGLRQLLLAPGPATAAPVTAEISTLRYEAVFLPETASLAMTVPCVEPADLFARIVDAARDLLERRAQLSIKECQGHDCDWLFIDTTKAGRRLWCHASTCGNRSRVRSFRARKG